MTETLLPISSISEKEKRAGLSLHPTVYIAIWILFSNFTILFNKWLIDNAGFRYPVLLTFWHMAFATLATQILARTTSWLDGRHQVRMTRRYYVRAIMPIGLLYSGSMVCSNLVYLYLNVSFIQMLKAAAPFSTLVVSWLWGQENPTKPRVLIVLVIVFGVVLTSAGEIHFSLAGLIFQVSGLVFESLRVVMVKDLMSEDGASMSPLLSLYYYAPTCAVNNLIVALAAESGRIQWSDISHTGIHILVMNALVAFLLNVSSVLLLGKTSSLILHLCGVLKSILLVMVSVLIWGTTVTPLQSFGYGIAIVGMVFFNTTWKDVKTGFTNTLSTHENAPGSRGYDRQQSMALPLRSTFMTLVSIMGLVLFYAYVGGKELHFWKWSWTSTAVPTELEHLAPGWLSMRGYGR